MANIKPNQQVNIVLDTQNERKILNCYVKEVYEDRLVISKPLEYEAYLEYFQEGCEIKTKIFTRFGVMLYKSLIIDPPTEEEFVIEYNEDEAKVVQRRVYSRIKLETVVDCEYSDAKENDFEDEFSEDEFVGDEMPDETKMIQFNTRLTCEFEKHLVEAETIDIGGGGMKIQTQEKLPIKKTISFNINLFDDIIVARGLIVENNDLPANQYGIKFTQIKEDDKDKIIKTCFKIESILNRK